MSSVNVKSFICGYSIVDPSALKCVTVMVSDNMPYWNGGDRFPAYIRVGV